VERVLPSAEVKARIGALAVGLAADCDSPESEVEQIMSANLAGAQMLPFAGFVSFDGKWVAGFSGYRDTGEFLKVLDTADKSPLLNATDAVRKKLAALVKIAEPAAKKGDWKTVVKACKDASKMFGRCPEREALAGFEKQALDWANGQFDAVVKDARSGADLTEARKKLNDVKRHFAGEPEGADADLGLKAIAKLSVLVAAEASGAPLPAGARAKAASEYKDSRWAQIFEKGPVPETPPEEGKK
jgi:hypothetical protein